MDGGTVGNAFEALGLVVAGYGIGKTWVDNATEPFWRPIHDLWRRVRAWVARRLRRQGQPQAVTATGISSRARVGGGHLFLGYQPLDAGMTPEAAIAKLDERLRRIHEDQQKAEHHLDDLLRGVERKVSSVRRGLAATDKRVDALKGEVVTEGLRVEAVGLGLVGLGLLLQAFGYRGLVYLLALVGVVGLSRHLMSKRR